MLDTFTLTIPEHLRVALIQVLDDASNYRLDQLRRARDARLDQDVCDVLTAKLDATHSLWECINGQISGPKTPV